MFSGKRKTFTMKNTVICDIDKFVHFLGKTSQGSIHDLFLLQVDFPPTEKWFRLFAILVDLGYIGIDNWYKIKHLYIPIKMPPTRKGQEKKELSYSEKQYNKAVNQIRVLVENAIGGIKRFDIVVNKFRNKIYEMGDWAINIATGLWNLELKVKII